MAMLAAVRTCAIVIVTSVLVACASGPGSSTTPPASSAPSFEAFVSAEFDFDHPSESEARFLALAHQAQERNDASAASEFLTQAARAQGLMGRLEEAQATLARSGAAQATSARLRARFELERGRLLRRAGDREGASQLFMQAYTIALENREDALAADAAHMMAMISPPEAGREWVERGLAIALESESTVARAWIGTISFNWATSLSARGDHEGAALYYARSLAARKEQLDAELIRTTEQALAHELALIGADRQARAILQRLLREAQAAGATTTDIDAELAALSVER